MNIEKGLKNTEQFEVTENLTAASLGSGLLPVLSTPAMIAFMEGVCQHSVQPYLSEGYGTVGAELNVRHVSATPVGMRVKAECELVSVDGNMYTFEVRAFDETGLIGEGTHKRCVINDEKFMKKTLSKLENRKRFREKKKNPAKAGFLIFFRFGINYVSVKFFYAVDKGCKVLLRNVDMRDDRLLRVLLRKEVKSVVFFVKHDLPRVFDKYFSLENIEKE